MIISTEQLEIELKTGRLESVYLLYGEEIYFIESILKKIKKNFGELMKGINYIIVDENNINELIPDIETPAFGYEKKLIIVKNTMMFKKETKKKSSSTSEMQAKLNEYFNNNFEDIKETNIIVFIEETADKTELFKTIEKLGVVFSSEKLELNQLIKRLKSIIVAYGVNIQDSTLKYLIETCGTSMQELINEIRKLIEYVGKGGTITNELVDQLGTKQIDAVIFDLTDNLGSKKTKNAMKVLNGLLANKEPVQRILITLYNHFKKIYITKLAGNKNLAQALNLKPNQLFLATKYKKQAELFDEKVLRQILKELADLDSNYKKGKIDLNLGLEAILCNYCS